ncbi:hypothetical protein K443DRAFT_12812 [Laccaria amethystina LaAM-08-1]|uniref:Uncharacterized protein n=1 Tax=Laccaria amethystina LaAM-08-1 TaxID=1095629 RepID=A0A0C9XBD6_9AGAR|nr:hypothetical protein K443DRAFT_12812 [Laccaria amethystina LaAM-08-1]
MPSEMRHGQEVEPPENQRVDQHSTQLQLVQPKDVSTVQGVNQTVEIHQAFVVLLIMAIGIVGAGLLTALAIVVTLAVMEVKDNNKHKKYTTGIVKGAPGCQPMTLGRGGGSRRA